MIDSLTYFRQFLSTSWGGLKSENFISMDLSNFRETFNIVGENGFFIPDVLNDAFTSLTRDGKLSPISVHGKVRSFRRYLDYLAFAEKEVFTSTVNIVKLNCMLMAVERTLLRKKKSCMRELMFKNRHNYDDTVGMLQDWRRLWTTHNHLSLINNLCQELPMNLSQDQYNVIINYLTLVHSKCMEALYYRTTDIIVS